MVALQISNFLRPIAIYNLLTNYLHS